ncbi:MAG: hypothetical protein AUJ92_00265 [Armatimonadetes bacterium CG2_30_59_28]|nr:MAG: hypothetical protein AUJ92_00265 [Armatimonadetes bacterium CG2_30_59_28]PIU66533.1 MAG: hypothetical protein COS85_04465 [Armatimonadetes bacterium CG07_land_8_20_14_0_80_59_28]PJB72572.1 MAG: hypothetical protein CO095_06725 [Armatimonadetes bacterium CG_4_9_14_3_um_filter_58_7]
MNTQMRAIKYGDNVYLRSVFSPQEDLLIRVGKGTNRQINFANVWLVTNSSGMSEKELTGGRLIHGNGDDSTPWNINGTYIGGNHGGAAVQELTCKGHGLTTADLGSEWSDAAGVRFFLIKVVDADRLWFLSQNMGKPDLWQFRTNLSGSALTRKAPPASLAFTGSHVAQLVPACRIARQDYLVNGKTPLEDGKEVSCDHFDIVEEYDIINPASLLEDVIAHPGVQRGFTADHLQAVIRNHIVYRFYPNGANVIHFTAEALQPFNVGYMGFIQSAPLSKGAFTTHEYYIPKTIPFQQDGISYDFRSIQDYSFKLPSPLLFKTTNNNLEDAGNLPDRFIQFLGRKENDHTVREVGYALGYSPVRGLTQPAERAKNVASSLMLYTSSKTYPSAIDSKMGPLIPAGKQFHCVAYRQYFNAAALKNATAFYYHEEDGDTIVYADYHKPVEKDVLQLPVRLTGKTISVVEKTPSLTLHTTKSVPASGLVVSVEGNYGYAVLVIR